MGALTLFVDRGYAVCPCSEAFQIQIGTALKIVTHLTEAHGVPYEEASELAAAAVKPPYHANRVIVSDPAEEPE